jgi:hypothetical protein
MHKRQAIVTEIVETFLPVLGMLGTNGNSTADEKIKYLPSYGPHPGKNMQKMKKKTKEVTIRSSPAQLCPLSEYMIPQIKPLIIRVAPIIPNHELSSFKG